MIKSLKNWLSKTKKSIYKLLKDNLQKQFLNKQKHKRQFDNLTSEQTEN